MLPKISNNTNSEGVRKENIASKLIVEDYMKGMLSKSQNVHYKPWKNKFAPKNPHSPFGDFPKEFVNKKAPTTKLDQDHEYSHASTKISKL